MTHTKPPTTSTYLPTFLPTYALQPITTMSHENLPPRVAKLIMREIRKLSKNAPDGVTFVPTDSDNLGEIYADIEGPEETPFYGGRFRLKLVIGAEFPMAPPKGTAEPCH